MQPKLEPLLLEITNARARLVQRMAADLSEELRRKAGFPVIWDSANLLDWEGVVDWKRYCKRLSEEIEELGKGGKYPLTSLGFLSNSLSRLSSVLSLLAGGEDKPPKVAVKINADENIKNRELQLTLDYAEVRVLFGGRQRNYVHVGNTGTTQAEVGSGDLKERAISIQMKQTGNDPQSLTNSFSNGLIGLLQKANSGGGILRPNDAQPGTWTIRVKMRDAAGKPEYVELMVSIEGASWPSQGEWPKIADLK